MRKRWLQFVLVYERARGVVRWPLLFALGVLVRSHPFATRWHYVHNVLTSLDSSERTRRWWSLSVKNGITFTTARPGHVSPARFVEFPGGKFMTGFSGGGHRAHILALSAPNYTGRGMSLPPVFSQTGARIFEDVQ